MGHMSPQERERAQQEAELLSEVSLGGGLSMLTILLESSPYQQRACMRSGRCSCTTATS